MYKIIIIILCGLLISCGGGDGESFSLIKKNNSPLFVEGFTPQSADLNDKKIRLFSAQLTSQQKILFDSQLNPKIFSRNYSSSENIILNKIGTKRTSSNLFFAHDASKFKWYLNPENKLSTSIIIASPDAQGIRLAINFKDISQGVVFVFRNSDNTSSYIHSSDELLAFSYKEKDGSLTYISPFIAGDELIVEVILSTADEGNIPKINFPYISHFNTANEPSDLIFTSGKSSYCQINAVCDLNSLKTSSSITKIIYTDPETGGSYVCSGTLLNDRISSGTPYLITAGHCINNQNTANTVQTFWFYNSLKCNEFEINPKYTSVSGGALFLHSDKATDISLIKMNKNPPQGVTFSGWSSANIENNNMVASLHHPRGDLQKISTGFIRNYLQCFFYPDQDGFKCKPIDSKTESNSTHYEVRWSSGVTEAGSSGSGLFVKINNNNYLIGNLTGGNESCEYPQGFAAFGRFDKSYNSALFNWLDNSSYNYKNSFYELADMLKKSIPR
jgi:V8-like Glu-specific endopeptidase